MFLMSGALCEHNYLGQVTFFLLLFILAVYSALQIQQLSSCCTGLHQRTVGGMREGWRQKPQSNCSRKQIYNCFQNACKYWNTEAPTTCLPPFPSLVSSTRRGQWSSRMIHRFNAFYLDVWVQIYKYGSFNVAGVRITVDYLFKESLPSKSAFAWLWVAQSLSREMQWLKKYSSFHWNHVTMWPTHIYIEGQGEVGLEVTL